MMSLESSLIFNHYYEDIMANTFSVTAFTSKTLGTFFENRDPILAMAYRGVREFETATGAGYAPGGVVNVKIPGNPTVQLGLSVTAEDIQDRVVPYTLTDQDIYNVDYAIDIQSIGIDVVGGELAFKGDPYKDPNNAKEMNPQAIQLIDDYVFPASQVIQSAVSTTLYEKCRVAAFKTPIDRPAKLGSIDSYDSIATVQSFMNELGFMNRRYAVLNQRDYQSVASSLQNIFNEPINRNITIEGKYGMKSLAGFDFLASVNIASTPDSPQITSGSPNITVASVAPDGSTITFSGVIVTAGLVFNAGTMIAIPSVKYFNNVNKIAPDTTLVVTVAQDANGDGAGNVTVTLSEPLVAVGQQANVDSLPAAAAPAEVFPGHKNNYFFIPMGVIANPLKLGRIAGADNNRYVNKAKNCDVTCYVQGLVSTGVNDYRMSMMCPTLAIPSYLVNLPSTL